MSETELPLRIIQRDKAIIIRCLCGAEGARVEAAGLTEAISPALVVRMIVHAKNCNPAQRALL